MPRKRPRVKLRYGRIILLSVLLASFVIMGAGIGFVVGAIRNMPQYDVERITGDLSSYVLDKDNQIVSSLKTDKNRTELDQNEIPPVMKKAMIAIEDQRFYQHHGVDLYRLGGAVIANITEGYGSEGASTITQQLVKIAVLENPEKKMRRKIQELFIALRLENMYTKEQILAFYLNNVYYGHGAWSLQTAAQTYFGKDAQNLELHEAAMLAGVVNAPGRYSPYLNPEKAKQRQALVLNEMVSIGAISKEQAESAKAKDFVLKGLTSANFKYQSFLDYVVDEASKALELDSQDIIALYTSGYKIYTTMDTKTQEAAEEVYANDKNFPPNKGDKIVQSAMVVLDPHTGEIRTLIGGRNLKGERQFNRAVDATRQPGSAFKPIAVYGPALEKGYNPATVLDDWPTEYQTSMGPKTFVNYDNKYRGLINMRTSIQYSINTTAVKMLEKIGINEGFNFAKNLGITTLVDSGKANDMGLSLALGGLTHGVSPLELTSAYGTFANQGIYVKPHAIRKIEDKEGNVLYENKTVKKVAMSPQGAYLLTDMLQTVVEAGTATKARLDRPVAGKTGTTSFDVDAWFVGYTPNLVGTVWLGYDKEENMKNVFGGGNGAPIWTQVMKVAHKDIPITPFPQPEGIATFPVDYKSGLLPSDLTPQDYVVIEKFNSAFPPLEVSNVWEEIPVCADTGQLLTDACPYPVTQVFLKRPIPWTGEIAPSDSNLEAPKDYCTLHGSGLIPGETGNLGFRLQGVPVVNNRNELQGSKLSWSYPAYSTSTVFRIYRSTSPRVPLVEENLIAEVSGGSQWQDNHIDNNIYYYAVTATDSQVGTAEPSNEIAIRPPIKTTDSSLKTPRLNGAIYLQGNHASVKLSWTKSSEEAATVYQVFRSETANFDPDPETRIALDETISDTTWTDNNLERHKTYYYRVVALNKTSGKQSKSSNQLQAQIN